MRWEVLLFLVVWALVTKFTLEPLLRHAMPRRFTVRYLLLATTALVLFMAIVVTIAKRWE